MRLGKLASILVLTLTLIVMFGSLAAAHHSIAGFDSKKEVNVRGTVVEFRWRNPHIIILWEAKDASGNVVQWSGEMASPTTMMQLGMSRTSLQKGDEVVFSVHPSAQGLPIALVTKIVRADGKVIVDRAPVN